MSGSEDLDGAAAIPPEIMPEAVAEEHRASREIGGMAVYAQPNDGSLYGSASDEEHDAAEEDGDVDADAAPTRAELLEKIALLEQQAEKLLEITMLSQSNEKEAIERAEEAEKDLLESQRTWMLTESTLRKTIANLEWDINNDGGATEIARARSEKNLRQLISGHTSRDPRRRDTVLGMIDPGDSSHSLYEVLQSVIQRPASQAQNDKFSEVLRTIEETTADVVGLAGKNFPAKPLSAEKARTIIEKLQAAGKTLVQSRQQLQLDGGTAYLIKKMQAVFRAHQLWHLERVFHGNSISDIIKRYGEMRVEEQEQRKTREKDRESLDDLGRQVKLDQDFIYELAGAIGSVHSKAIEAQLKPSIAGEDKRIRDLAHAGFAMLGMLERELIQEMPTHMSENLLYILSMKGQLKFRCNGNLDWFGLVLTQELIKFEQEFGVISATSVRDSILLPLLLESPEPSIRAWIAHKRVKEELADVILKSYSEIASQIPDLFRQAVDYQRLYHKELWQLPLLSKEEVRAKHGKEIILFNATDNTSPCSFCNKKHPDGGCLEMRNLKKILDMLPPQLTQARIILQEVKSAARTDSDLDRNSKMNSAVKKILAVLDAVERAAAPKKRGGHPLRNNPRVLTFSEEAPTSSGGRVEDLGQASMTPAPGKAGVSKAQVEEMLHKAFARDKAAPGAAAGAIAAGANFAKTFSARLVERKLPATTCAGWAIHGSCNRTNCQYDHVDKYKGSLSDDQVVGKRSPTKTTSKPSTAGGNDVPIAGTECLYPGCGKPQRKRGAKTLEYCSTEHFRASQEKVHHVSDGKPFPEDGPGDIYAEIGGVDLTPGGAIPTCFHLREGQALQAEPDNICVDDDDLCQGGFTCACCTYVHGGDIHLCTICGSSTAGFQGIAPVTPFPKPKKQSRRARVEAEARRVANARRATLAAEARLAAQEMLGHIIDKALAVPDQHNASKMLAAKRRRERRRWRWARRQYVLELQRCVQAELGGGSDPSMIGSTMDNEDVEYESRQERKIYPSRHFNEDSAPREAMKAMLGADDNVLQDAIKTFQKVQRQGLTKFLLTQTADESGADPPRAAMYTIKTDGLYPSPTRGKSSTRGKSFPRSAGRGKSFPRSAGRLRQHIQAKLRRREKDFFVTFHELEEVLSNDRKVAETRGVNRNQEEGDAEEPDQNLSDTVVEAELTEEEEVISSSDESEDEEVITSSDESALSEDDTVGHSDAGSVLSLPSLIHSSDSSSSGEDTSNDDSEALPGMVQSSDGETSDDEAIDGGDRSSRGRNRQSDSGGSSFNSTGSIGNTGNGHGHGGYGKNDGGGARKRRNDDNDDGDDWRRAGAGRPLSSDDECTVPNCRRRRVAFGPFCRMHSDPRDLCLEDECPHMQFSGSGRCAKHLQRHLDATSLRNVRRDANVGGRTRLATSQANAREEALGPAQPPLYTMCRYPRCDRECSPGHPFCGRAHAQAFARLTEDPFAHDGPSICQLRGCELAVYPGHPFCSRTHAMEYARLQNGGSQQPTCRLKGCMSPSIMGYDFCKREHADLHSMAEEAQTDRRAARGNGGREMLPAASRSHRASERPDHSTCQILGCAQKAESRGAKWCKYHAPDGRVCLHPTCLGNAIKSRHPRGQFCLEHLASEHGTTSSLYRQIMREAGLHDNIRGSSRGESTGRAAGSHNSRQRASSFGGDAASFSSSIRSSAGSGGPPRRGCKGCGIKPGCHLLSCGDDSTDTELANEMGGSNLNSHSPPRGNGRRVSRQQLADADAARYEGTPAATVTSSSEQTRVVKQEDLGESDGSYCCSICSDSVRYQEYVKCTECEANPMHTRCVEGSVWAARCPQCDRETLRSHGARQRRQKPGGSESCSSSAKLRHHASDDEDDDDDFVVNGGHNGGVGGRFAARSGGQPDAGDSSEATCTPGSRTAGQQQNRGIAVGLRFASDGAGAQRRAQPGDNRHFNSHDDRERRMQAWARMIVESLADPDVRGDAGYPGYLPRIIPGGSGFLKSDEITPLQTRVPDTVGYRWVSKVSAKSDMITGRYRRKPGVNCAETEPSPGIFQARTGV